MKGNNILLLLPIQELDKKLFSIRKIIETEPMQLEVLQKQLDTINNDIAELKNLLKNTELKKKGYESDISGIDEKIKKLKDQILTAKKITNEEYQIILKQVSGLESDKKVTEDKWLESEMTAEQTRKLISSKDQDKTELHAIIARKQQEISQRVAKLKEDSAKLSEQRNNMLKGINSEILKVYNRVLNSESTDGIALAKVIQQAKKKKTESIEDFIYSCEGCSVELTTQDVNQILLGSEIVQCRNCSRILYLCEQVQHSS